MIEFAVTKDGSTREKQIYLICLMWYRIRDKDSSRWGNALVAKTEFTVYR